VANKFRCGELVRLNSGGPIMTVQEEFVSPFKGTEYRCQWFVGDQYKSKVFPGQSLERVLGNETRNFR
jgi:uncharacterized protein YodC (DUF2158 family)